MSNVCLFSFQFEISLKILFVSNVGLSVINLKSAQCVTFQTENFSFEIFMSDVCCCRACMTSLCYTSDCDGADR